MSERCVKSPQLRHNQPRFNPSRASPKPLVATRKPCPVGRLQLDLFQTVHLLAHFGSVNRGSNPRAPATVIRVRDEVFRNLVPLLFSGFGEIATIVPQSG